MMTRESRRYIAKVVMVGLVPTIHSSSRSGGCREVGPRDKPENDIGRYTI
jgi:hypothetical protein